MAWMQCRGCSAKFAVGLLRCPQCQAVSELYAVPEEVIEAEQEANMPKISVEGGPSNALGQPLESEVAVVATEPETPAAATTEAPASAELETSDETSAAMDEVAGPEESAAGEDAEVEVVPAPTAKTARKTAAKKAAAKQEPAPQK